MPNDSTLCRPEIDDRVAILRDNIRQLTEQAAGSSGAADEERTANRIAIGPRFARTRWRGPRVNSA